MTTAKVGISSGVSLSGTLATEFISGRELIIVKCRISTLSSTFYCFVWDTNTDAVATDIPSAEGGPMLTFPSTESDLDYWKSITNGVGTETLWIAAGSGDETLLEDSCTYGAGEAGDCCTNGADCVDNKYRDSAIPGFTDHAQMHKFCTGSGVSTPAEDCLENPCHVISTTKRYRETYALSVSATVEGASPIHLEHQHLGSYRLTASIGGIDYIQSSQDSDETFVLDAKQCTPGGLPFVYLYNKYYDGNMALSAKCPLGTLYSESFVELDWEDINVDGGYFGYDVPPDPVYTSKKLEMRSSSASIATKATNLRTDINAVQIFHCQHRFKLYNSASPPATYTDRVIKCIATAKLYEDASIVNPFTMSELEVFSTEIENLIEYIYNLFGAASTTIENAFVTCEVRS